MCLSPERPGVAIVSHGGKVTKIMDEQLEILMEVAKRLESAGIAYMVTGSMAMMFYSVPRMTRDLDIVIDAGPEDVDALFDLFKKDCYVDRSSVAQAISRRGMFNVIHEEWAMKVDFIVRKETAYRRLEFDARKRIDVEGVALCVVAPEDLLLSKLDWARRSGSELQIRDARTMVKTVEGLDWKYLEEWSAKLGVDALLRSVKQDD